MELVTKKAAETPGNGQGELFARLPKAQRGKAAHEPAPTEWRQIPSLREDNRYMILVERLDERMRHYAYDRLRPWLVSLVTQTRAIEKAPALFRQKARMHENRQQDLFMAASEIPLRKVPAAEKMLRKLGSVPDAELAARRSMSLMHLSAKVKAQAVKEGWEDRSASEIRQHASALSMLAQMSAILRSGDIEGFVAYYQKELPDRSRKGSKAAKMLLEDNKLSGIVEVDAYLAKA